jgi:hypothetical protein
VSVAFPKKSELSKCWIVIKHQILSKCPFPEIKFALVLILLGYVRYDRVVELDGLESIPRDIKKPATRTSFFALNYY